MRNFGYESVFTSLYQVSFSGNTKEAPEGFSLFPLFPPARAHAHTHTRVLFPHIRSGLTSFFPRRCLGLLSILPFLLPVVPGRTTLDQGKGGQRERKERKLCLGGRREREGKTPPVSHATQAQILRRQRERKGKHSHARTHAPSRVRRHRFQRARFKSRRATNTLSLLARSCTEKRSRVLPEHARCR